MKKIYLISAAVLSILAAASCEKEIAPADSVRTTISATIVAPKTALGDKTGTSWPNHWTTGDKISVNGTESDALDSEANGKSTATFTFAGLVSTPYCAAYPASAVSGYSDGSATVTVPATQNYVAGSYDPAAFVMCGKSTDAAAVALSPFVSVVHLSLTGTASINKVKITGATDAALSGPFTTNFSGTFTPGSTVSNEVEMVAATPVDLPAEFFICVPSGLSGAITVDIFDNNGGSMTKHATIASPLVAGQVNSPEAFAYTPSSNITISAEGITSSTAIICWDNAPTAAYTISVYENDGTTLKDSYAVGAGHTCWGGASPRFCVSGLTPATSYKVKVVNPDTSAESNVLTVTTADFTIVPVTSTSAAVNDVILAEDFGELRWDSELINGGVGYFPTSQTSFANSEVDSFLPIDTNTEKVLGSQTTALGESRLEHWAQGANNNLYIHPGYIKLVGSSKVTHLVTPALDNIPEGKLATLEVKVTACPYYSESSAAYATMNAIVAVQPAGTYNELKDETNTNTLDLTTNVAPITLDAVTAWKEYTVTLTGVGKGGRLAFGAASNIEKNNARMNISDMKVTITALEDVTLTASAKSVSSSSAVFTWTYGGEAAADIAKPYTAALYSNSACTDLVVSFDIPASSDCWDGKTPCFAFGGLTPATPYWFQVQDTDSGTISDPVSITTEAFTPVDPTTVTNAAVGDVILAEDFSEIGWGADMLEGAAGFIPLSKTLDPAVGALTDTDGNFTKYNNTSGRIYGDTRVASNKRLFNWGFYGNSNVFSYAGYLRLGNSSSGTHTHIVSPALSGIPAGKSATIDVTVTSALYETTTDDVAVFINDHSTLSLVLAPDQKENSSFSGSGGKYNGVSLDGGHPLQAEVKNWTTNTVRINKVTSNDCIIIGPYQSVDKKNRFFLNDVVVTIVSMKDPGAIDAVMEINDFTTLKAFLTACEPGLTIQGDVTADIDLTTAQAEEIDALYPVAEFEGIINGNNHTISGLTKPLFGQFTGTVSNLTLNSNVNITTAMNNVGILAQSASDATLTGCISRGSVTSSVSAVDGDLALGGLVGTISGCTLSVCQNHATVTNNTAASGTAYIGGLIGVANGVNNLSGDTTDYNYNQGLIIEESASLDIAVGGVCGYSSTAASNFNYCKSLAPDSETDYDDIEIKNSTKNKVYVGGIIGKSSVTSSMDYTYNSSDIKFTSLAITQSGQVFGGGIIGGWTASGEQTITGCSNKGWVYTKASAGDLAVADSENKPKYWSCFGGIAGMGAGTSEALKGGFNTITGKTFNNCSNSGTIRIYAALRCCIGGVVAYTENDPDGCVCTATDIRPYLSGGIAQVGDNYHRNICGGVVGLCTASKVSNLKSTAKIVSQSSSPFAYTGGILGYVYNDIELENCRISNHVQAAGSGDGRSALMCNAAQNTLTVTFTNCVIKSGTISYSTGKKVTISSSNIAANHCAGPGSNFTIANDVLPSVESSID